MPTENTTELLQQATETVKAMQATQEKITAELKSMVTENQTQVKTSVDLANSLAEKLQGMSAKLLDIEQKIADDVRLGTAAPETLGQMVIKSEQFKQYAMGNSSKFSIMANTIIGQEGSPPVNSDTLVPAQRVPGIIPGAFRLLKVRDILPSGVTTSNNVEFARELLATNNAAETAEGALKPESVLTFELADAPVRTIATFIKASKQVLSDAPQLQSYIDTRLRYFVDYRTDSQLLNGNGSGQNIGGILKSGNFTAFTPTTGENALDSINRAIYRVYTADYAPDAIIMNPADWGAIERLKVGTSDANYIVGNPTGILGPQLWGLPVVVTNACPQGTFIVGAFGIAYQVWNRMGTVVEMFEQDDDNVQKNLVTIRAENRLALAVYRPASVFAGSLSL